MDPGPHHVDGSRGRAGTRPPAGSSGTGRDEAPVRVGLGELMGEIARSLQQRHGDVEATLEAITRTAVISIPGTEECGVSLVIERRRVESRAATGRLPQEIDQVQEDLGEGPCLDAVFEQKTVRIDSIREEHRWPRFRRLAAENGLGSLCRSSCSSAATTWGR